MSTKTKNVDIVIVGAGFAGLYALHHLRGLGYDAIIVEAASGVGGTWFWNRYPGARVDIESVEYSYSFSEELQQEWKWSERYAAQPELLRYLNHVTDRFDLRRSIQFNTRVTAAAFDEKTDHWKLQTNNDETIVTKFCLMATGILNAANVPDFPGMNLFKGPKYHTAYWPEENIDFSGQRVAVIGTGSSAIQCIPIIAQQAKHLTVFQRTPSFAVPQRNCPMPPEYEKSVKDNYAEWRRFEKYESAGAFTAVNFKQAPRITTSAMDATPEERLALYEDRWKSGGLAMYLVYEDVFTNFESNETLAEFLRDKIRQRVKDPEVAELLVPKGYPVLGKRLCADNGYYETFNRDNVTLVDIRGTSLEITAKGIKAKGVEHEFDCIIFATGFDAMTGSLNRIDVRGRNGLKLKDNWKEGAVTAMGLMTAGFPNLFFLNGPGSPAPLYQPVLLAEEQSRWIGQWLNHMRDNGLTHIEPNERVQKEWVDHVTEVIDGSIFPKAASWYMGANIPGKKPIGLAYFGSIAHYRTLCNAVQDSGFKDFELGRAQM